MEPIKAVLRYSDGAILKGYIRDLHPHRATFYFQPNAQGVPPREMGIDGLKALLLVKSFEGNSDYRERKELMGGYHPYGDKLEVAFNDGEMIQGLSVGCHPEQPGFFLLPPDPKSNNLLLLVVSSAVKKLRYL
jgi:hypothetical protein